MRVRYRAQALADIDEIRRYLQKRSPSGARNVIRSIIAENPRASEETDDPDVRVKAVLEYPYKQPHRQRRLADTAIGAGIYSNPTTSSASWT